MNQCETLSSTLQIDCVDCGDGRTRCVSVDLTSASGSVGAGLALEPVDNSNCHAMCADNTADCSL